MAWTKRAIVETAYEEIGVSAALGYDVTPEQMALGLSRLDALMEELYQQGYRLTYNAPAEYRGGDLDDDSGIPAGANQAVYLSLALRLAPTIGRQVSMETKAAHRTAMNAIAIGPATLPTVRRDTDAVPAGAGNLRVRWPDRITIDRDYADPLSANQPDALGEY